MKSFYTSAIILSSLFLFNGCSKDAFKPYDDRIIGTWRLEEVKKVGIGGDRGDLPFLEGSFTFTENGSLTWVTNAGEVYSGTWDIRKRTTSQWSNQDNQNNTEVLRTLEITAVNFTSQQVRSEFFDEINFTQKDKFKAYVREGLHQYVFHFER